jgi:hypothetical protein
MLKSNVVGVGRVIEEAAELPCLVFGSGDDIVVGIPDRYRSVRGFHFPLQKQPLPDVKDDSFPGQILFTAIATMLMSPASSAMRMLGILQS